MFTILNTLHGHCKAVVIPDRVLRMRKQSGVRQILKVCKERTCMSAVNTCSQNSRQEQ